MHVASSFPLFHPFTKRRLARSVSSAFPSLLPAISVPRRRQAVTNVGSVEYLLSRIVSQPPNSPPSILFVALESWLSEPLRPEIMPHLCHSASVTIQVDLHVSGGATTVRKSPAVKFSSSAVRSSGDRILGWGEPLTPVRPQRAAVTEHY